MNAKRVEKPGFFAYVLAILLPPLSFFAQGKVVAGIVSLVIAFFSFLLIWLPFIPICFWFLLSGWAVFGLSKRAQEATIQDLADRTGRAVAEAQRK